jgi:hypothetical protein
VTKSAFSLCNQRTRNCCHCHWRSSGSSLQALWELSGSSLGALWELSGSSLGARCSCRYTYWVSLFLRHNSLIFRTGVSCFSITLFYSTLLALTDGRNHWQRNEYTSFAWAGGTFFSVVLLCQFLVLAGNRFWFYILLMYLEYYSCGVVLVFWFWREIVFGVTYVLVYNTVVWLCHFFVVVGKLFCTNFLVESEFSSRT